MNKLFILTMLGISFSLSAQGTIEVDADDLPIEAKPSISVSSDKPSVVILNNQKSNQNSNQVTKTNSQPTVQVLGQPVSETYAVELKKSRYEAELQTEQKIVERLESSRLRDEQERLNKMFGNTSPLASTATVAPVVSTTSNQVSVPSAPESAKKAYVGFHGGQASNFTSLENVNSYGSLGISFGTFAQSGLMVKSDFFYSKHRIDNMYSIYSNYGYDEYRDKTMSHQLSGSLTLGYTPSFGRFRPYAGASIAYNHWIHSAYTDDSQCKRVSLRDCKNQVKTDTVNLGLTTGVDFQLSQRLSIGFNMLVNVYNIYNNLSDRIADYDDYSRNDENPVYIEETNWLIASINAKLYF